MKRILAALLIAGLGLAGTASVGADESIDEDDCSGLPTESNPCWGDSALAPGPTTVTDISWIGLSGSFSRIPARTIRVVLRGEPASGAPGCTLPEINYLDDTVPREEGFSRDYRFSGAIEVPCNGRYVMEAVAITTDDAPDPVGPSPSPRPHDEAVLDRTVSVAVPPPDVTGVDAVEGQDRAVTVSWSPVLPRPTDLIGYAIERRTADGQVMEAFAAKDETTFVDASPPGGEATYSVFALRPGATMDSNVRSRGAGSKVVTVSPAPTSTSTGGSTPGTGGSGPGSTAGSWTGRPGSTASGPGRSSGPAIQVPRVGTPSRSFFPALLAPPDTGYLEELPYDLSDQDDADDELAMDEPLEALPGRGLAIPIATGLVLGVWALHLRFLARASRPQYEDPIEFLR